MKAAGVLLDTNIYLRATALQPGEIIDVDSSKHDRDSSPEALGSGLSPRECRALICAQLLRPPGVYMPKRQAAELHHAIGSMRRQNASKPHNDRLIACIEQFSIAASAGQNVPFMRAQVDLQYRVLSSALAIAQNTIAFVNSPLQHVAKRFIVKHESYLSRALPEPNHALLMAGRPPFIWNDFFLCYAAKRAGTVVVTVDRDFEILSDAFLRETEYNPARVLSYYPDERDAEHFRQAISKGPPPQASGPDI